MFFFSLNWFKLRPIFRFPLSDSCCDVVVCTSMKSSRGNMQKCCVNKLSLPLPPRAGTNRVVPKIKSVHLDHSLL